MYKPALNRSALIQRLDFAMTKKDVVAIAEAFLECEVYPNEVLTIAVEAKGTTAFHAAWVLENMLVAIPEALDYYLPEIVTQLPATTNASVQRHLLKLTAIGIKRIIKRETSRTMEREFWKMNLEPLEESCFLWLVDCNSKPAVKVHCMEILYLLSYRQKWIAEELPHVIESQMNISGPAIAARGKEVLKSLSKKRNVRTW